MAGVGLEPQVYGIVVFFLYHATIYSALVKWVVRSAAETSAPKSGEGRQPAPHEVKVRIGESVERTPDT